MQIDLIPPADDLNETSSDQTAKDKLEQQKKKGAARTDAENLLSKYKEEEWGERLHRALGYGINRDVLDKLAARYFSLKGVLQQPDTSVFEIFQKTRQLETSMHQFSQELFSRTAELSEKNIDEALDSVHELYINFDEDGPARGTTVLSVDSSKTADGDNQWIVSNGNKQLARVVVLHGRFAGIGSFYIPPSAKEPSRWPLNGDLKTQLKDIGRIILYQYNYLQPRTTLRENQQVGERVEYGKKVHLFTGMDFDVNYNGDTYIFFDEDIWSARTTEKGARIPNISILEQGNAYKLLPFDQIQRGSGYNYTLIKDGKGVGEISFKKDTDGNAAVTVYVNGGLRNYVVRKKEL